VRIVLDTNVWLSALMFSAKSSPPRRILEHLTQGDFELIVSPDLVNEFDEIMRRHGLPQPALNQWLDILNRTCLNIPPYVRHIKPTQPIDAPISDPDDNRVLECAVEGKADIIVSGDKHLLKLARYQDIEILTPRDFIARLSQEK